MATLPYCQGSLVYMRSCLNKLRERKYPGGVVTSRDTKMGTGWKQSSCMACAAPPSPHRPHHPSPSIYKRAGERHLGFPWCFLHLPMRKTNLPRQPVVSIYNETKTVFLLRQVISNSKPKSYHHYHDFFPLPMCASFGCHSSDTFHLSREIWSLMGLELPK